MKSHIMCRRVIALFVIIAASAAFIICQAGNEGMSGLTFEVSFPESLLQDPVDGRLLLMISNNDQNEPRFQINYRSPDAQQIFGIDVE